MHELTGKLSNISFSYTTGKPCITFEFDDKHSALSMADALYGADKLTIKIGKFRQKRSLDANAYAWLLIGKIAEKTNATKQEVYREAIRDIGVYDVVCIKEEAAPALRSAWESHGIGWQTEVMLSKLDGCTNVLLYYGSSTYDVEQMSRLIENIIQDCRALGIETKSSEEIESLLKEWEQ